MAIWSRIKRLKPTEFFQLFRAFLSRPQFLWPTYSATRKTIETCDKLFGKDHHQDNRTNAFRHALWNYQIAEACFSVSNSVEKSLKWSKKITDLHERLAPNEALSREMDLHNNRIGREVFEKFYAETGFDALKYFQEQMQKAVKVTSVEEIKNQPGKQIYIENRT